MLSKARKHRHLRVMETPEPKPENKLRVDRIITRLKAMNLTPRAASIKAGLGPDAIRDLERGKAKNPRRSTIEALAETLDADIDYFYDQQDVPRAIPESVSAEKSAAFTLEYDEIALIGLFRMLKEVDEHERFVAVGKTLLDASLAKVDSRGRRAAG